jgi:hypothetical protein
VTRMQVIIQLFVDILQVAGGDLALEKCTWYLICHTWENGKARLSQPHEKQKCISLLSRATGSMSVIKRNSHKEGHITLVFQMRGDSLSNAHNKIMSEKSVLILLFEYRVWHVRNHAIT